MDVLPGTSAVVGSTGTSFRSQSTKLGRAAVWRTSGTAADAEPAGRLPDRREAANDGRRRSRAARTRARPIRTAHTALVSAPSPGRRASLGAGVRYGGHHCDMARPNNLTDDEIVEIYLAWCEAEEAQESDTPVAKAWEVMADLADDDPERGWALLLRVIALAGMERETLCAAGSDCLENLFRNHGPRFIDRIEHEARCDPKFRRALACVWNEKNPLRPRVDALLADLGQPRL